MMNTFTPRPAPATLPGSNPAELDPDNLNEQQDPDNNDVAKDQDLTPPDSPNADAPLSTPPTSPDTHDHNAPSIPSTPPPRNKPDSTPLYRRFLKEVTMSPATPPRSPTREERCSPSKRSESPTKGRGTPTNGRASPAKQKLEVGLNGFHFTCELPMSKITPKKNTEGTPKRGTPSSINTEAVSIEGSPKKGTLSKTPFDSPLRKAGTPGSAKSSRLATNSSPKKDTPTIRRLFVTTNHYTRGLPREAVNDGPKPSTPTKAPFGTPLRKMVTPNSVKHPSTTRTSPAKSMKTASRHAQDLPSSPESTLHAPPCGLRNTTNEISTGQHGASGLQKSSEFPDISKSGGRAMVELKCFKPARGTSTDIGSLMANFQTQKHQGGSPAARKHTGDAHGSAPPTPLRRAARGLEVTPIIRYTSKSNMTVASAILVKLSPMSSPEVVEVKNVAELASTGLPTIPSKKAEEFGVAHPLHKSSPAILNPSVHSSLQTKGTPSQHTPLLFSMSESEPEPKPKLAPSSRHLEKHIQIQGQDPFTSLAKPKFYKTPQSVGTDPDVLLAIHKEMDNLKQSLSSSLGVPYTFPSYGSANDFVLPVMANPASESAQQPRRALERTKSGVSNTSVSTTSSISTMRASMLMNPKNPNATPKATLKAKWPYVGVTPAKARRQGLDATKKMDAKQATAVANRTRLRPTPTRKAAPGPSVKPHSLLEASGTVKVSAEPRVTPTFTRHKLSATQARTLAKPIAGGIPRSSRKLVFESTRPVPTTKRPKSVRKSNFATPSLKAPYDPSSDPRPYEKKFANATDIADRVAEWNSEKKKRDAVKIEGEEKTPSKKKGKGKEGKDSFTPEGLPTKLPLPPRSPTKPPRLLPTPGTPRAFLTPRRAAPGVPILTPHPRTPVPRTPALRHLMDPNAYRTPSKEIQSSLDKAIDRKIEEDRRRGRAWRDATRGRAGGDCD